MLTSKENNKASEKLSNKVLEIINDTGIIVSYLLSRLSKVTNPESASQFKLVKISNSNRVNELLIHNSIPVTLYNNLLAFRDTGEIIELKADLSKMIINKNYNVDLARLADENFCMILQRSCILMLKLQVIKH